MKLTKFIQKQGNVRDSLPKAFEEGIEFGEILKDKKIIPLSSIKAELIKCSVKGAEPKDFPIISDGKYSKFEIDCFNHYINICLPDHCVLKSYSSIEFENDEFNNFEEYFPINKVSDDQGNIIYTIFFGDFLKILLNELYINTLVPKSFYDRLGPIPVIFNEEKKCQEPWRYIVEDDNRQYLIYYPIADKDGKAHAYIHTKI